MIPTILQIGPIPIHSFGLTMVLAYLAAWYLFAKNLESVGEPYQKAEQIVFYVAAGGIIGARGLYILSNLSEFLSDPMSMIFSGAGFVFYGGFIGGLFAFYLAIRREERNYLSYLDLAAAPMAIGYAIGRLGCQLSGDGDYGRASDLPWAISYSLGYVPTEVGELVHPTPVYESVAALLTAWLLVKLGKTLSSTGVGRVCGLYFALAALSRFLVEFLRRNPEVSYGLSQAQLISIPCILFGCFLLIRKKLAV